jgi:hypothetical protein
MPPHPLAQNALTRRMAGVMLLGGFAIGFAPAKANTSVNERALAAFQAGRWQEAADLAIAIATPDNQAFAARALLAGALLTSNIAARQSSIATAKRFAEAALATTPRHVEARLQLATALGLQARAGSPTRAFARGLPQRVRRILDGVVRDAPGEAWAYALLGGWHLEGLRIGGGAARAMLGCDLAAGKAAFGRAMRLIPRPPRRFILHLHSWHWHPSPMLWRRARFCFAQPPAQIATRFKGRLSPAPPLSAKLSTMTALPALPGWR